MFRPPAGFHVFGNLPRPRMAALDVVHTSDYAWQRRIFSCHRLHEDAMDPNLKCGQESLEKSPRIEIEAGRILMPPVLPRDGRLNNAWKKSILIACNVMLRSLRYVRSGRGTSCVEFLRTPLEKSPRIEIEAGRILMPPVLPRDGRLNNAWKKSQSGAIWRSNAVSASMAFTRSRSFVKGPSQEYERPRCSRT